ncbi:MAG: hypothetical protein DMG49_03390 [Acidobacteria bacterium]|nr:MAG: hypothetical protein DMG49_03390 [Acidobacteriota bacterium]
MHQIKPSGIISVSIVAREAPLNSVEIDMPRMDLGGFPGSELMKGNGSDRAERYLEAGNE